MHAWYEPRTGKYAFLSVEITGYAITTLLFLNSVDRNPFFVERAEAAAHWLLDQAVEPTSGAVLCRFDGTRWLERQCAFDNGVCLNAFVNLYRETRDETYLHAAVRLGEWLIAVVRRPDGSFYAKYDPRTQSPMSPGGKWSLISGPFLVKIATGLTNLADVTREKRYVKAVEELCSWGLACQEADGRFPTARSRRDTFLHPHCYTAEGLLVAGLGLRRDDWIEAAARAVTWIAPHQLPLAGFPAFYHGGDFLPLESPDISAQVLRLYLLLPDSLREQIQLDPAGVVRSIAASQSQDSSPAANGGIASGDAWFREHRDGRNGEHLNAWVTMFSLQALLALENGMRDSRLLV